MRIDLACCGWRDGWISAVLDRAEPCLRSLMPGVDYTKLPNLAQLQSFQRDLNYTGVIAEGWNDPVNVVPLGLLLFCLLTVGVPRGALSVWVLLNTALIHPMDL